MGHTVGASEIAGFLCARLLGIDFQLSRLGSIEDACGAVCFVTKSSVSKLSSFHAMQALVIAYKGFHEIAHRFSPGAFSYIEVDNPRLAFIKAANHFFPRHKRSIPIVHPSSEVRPSAVLSGSVTIGECCLIKSGAVIGEEGFGFEYDPDGIPLRFPHVGGVRIGNNVEVGANTVICRGALGDTIIENHVKIDDRCFIAHNVHIGARGLIIAGAEISGSVKIGEGAWIGPNAAIKEKIQIGKDALVGIGAVVIRDVPPNTVVVGNPARELRKRFPEKE